MSSDKQTKSNTLSKTLSNTLSERLCISIYTKDLPGPEKKAVFKATVPESKFSETMKSAIDSGKYSNVIITIK